MSIRIDHQEFTSTAAQESATKYAAKVSTEAAAALRKIADDIGALADKSRERAAHIKSLLNNLDALQVGISGQLSKADLSKLSPQLQAYANSYRTELRKADHLFASAAKTKDVSSLIAKIGSSLGTVVTGVQFVWTIADPHASEFAVGRELAGMGAAILAEIVIGSATVSVAPAIFAAVTAATVAKLAWEAYAEAIGLDKRGPSFHQTILERIGFKPTVRDRTALPPSVQANLRLVGEHIFDLDGRNYTWLIFSEDQVITVEDNGSGGNSIRSYVGNILESLTHVNFEGSVLTQSANKDGDWESLLYDADGRLAARMVLERNGTRTITNFKPLFVEQIVASASGAIMETSIQHYGSGIIVVSASGEIMQPNYGEFNRDAVRGMFNADGSATVFNYNPDGTLKESATWDKFGHLIEFDVRQIRPSNSQEQFVDSAGRLHVKIVRPDGKYYEEIHASADINSPLAEQHWIDNNNQTHDRIWNGDRFQEKFYDPRLGLATIMKMKDGGLVLATSRQGIAVLPPEAEIPNFDFSKIDTSSLTLGRNPVAVGPTAGVQPPHLPPHLSAPRQGSSGTWTAVTLDKSSDVVWSHWPNSEVNVPDRRLTLPAGIRPSDLHFPR
ncbi:hypothetical protein C9I57_17535 [Trinickia symbiotica]|uniref:Uncharacterized protein n=1 Tax=Trinickia symbiotica TaxID=863227 RepID=A0A2T3XSI8_9BURK|nr:hypothetical protein [Trinickia symbiotica]PTB19489.1 hypothetical protein C9I57_17535 [Trinickia symbiotica]